MVCSTKTSPTTGRKRTQNHKTFAPSAEYFFVLEIVLNCSTHARLTEMIIVPNTLKLGLEYCMLLLLYIFLWSPCSFYYHRVPSERPPSFIRPPPPIFFHIERIGIVNAPPLVYPPPPPPLSERPPSRYLASDAPTMHKVPKCA